MSKKLSKNGGTDRVLPGKSNLSHQDYSLISEDVARILESSHAVPIFTRQAVILATVEALRSRGWRSSGAQRLGGRIRAQKQVAAIVYRWGAILTILESLPENMSAHPFSDQTLSAIRKRLSEEKIEASEATIKHDLLGLGIRKPKNTG
jgi:hypothetical protein